MRIYMKSNYMKNQKFKLKLMNFVCWTLTIILIGVIIFQVWLTYNRWNDFDEFSKGGTILYIVFQVMILSYATANLVVLWNSYLYEKHQYKKDSKHLYHI